MIRQLNRKIEVLTCAGKIELDVVYGQDPGSKRWHCPLKEALGLSGRLPLSPLLAKRYCFTATQSLSFEACAQIASLWGATPVNEAMIHRYVQKYGKLVDEQQQQEMEWILDPATRQEALKRLEDSMDQDTSLVMMLDGWMIRERGAQWGLQPPDELANRVDWREMKTGIVFRLSGRGETQSGRRIIVEKYYEACRGDPFDFGQRLFALALRHGLRQARRAYVIADGAVWIWNLAQDRFHGAVQGLDFYHASEHLRAVAETLFPDDPKRARQWWELRKQRLKENGTLQVDRLLRELKQLIKTLEIQPTKPLQEQIGYFERNRERMDYPQLEQQGAPIGSGAIESTCAQMQDRFKRSGQFWKQKGCRNLMALELARRNNDWERIWGEIAA